MLVPTCPSPIPRLNRLLPGGSLGTGTSAFADFERMSSRIDAVEAEASLSDELEGRTAASLETDRKLAALGGSTAVDDALAELKKKLGS